MIQQKITLTKVFPNGNERTYKFTSYEWGWNVYFYCHSQISEGVWKDIDIRNRRFKKLNYETMEDTLNRAKRFFNL